MKIINVAGGCFWGVEHYFSLVKGIEKTRCVYLNSEIENITYEQTCSGLYNAVEAVELHYNDQEISLQKIIELLNRIVDPTSLNKQGGDKGVQYRIGFYTNDQNDQEIINTELKNIQLKYQQPLVYEVMEILNTSDAEEYHQKYLYKNINGYCHIDMNKLREEDLK
jgi:peptide-methionine (S)-S-oxide reductase